MKILFLTRLFYPHLGGVEKHVYNIALELQKIGHDVSVITEQYNKSLKKFEVYNSINIYRIPVPNSESHKKFHIWKWVINNKNLFKHSDIIHAHDVFYWLIPIKILHPSKNLYTTFHGYEGNNLPTLKQRQMHRLAANLSKGTISIGRFYKKWYGTNSKIISYGASSRMFRSQPKSSKSTNISFLGRLELETGIDEYIDSMILLKDKVLRLDVYGDGQKKSSIEKKVKKNKLTVKIHSWVDDPEKKISTSDIVFTSRYLGIIEALSMRKFVIAIYNNSIKKDYLEMTPFAKYISIVKSPLEIAQQVRSYLKNPKKYSQAISSGYSWAYNQTWEKLAKEYISLWN